MKHLTTDVGCVGFLTDCGSYDRLMEEVSARPILSRIHGARIPTAGMAQVMTSSFTVLACNECFYDMYIGLQSSHLRTLLVSLTGISKFCTHSPRTSHVSSTTNMGPPRVNRPGEAQLCRTSFLSLIECQYHTAPIAVSEDTMAGNACYSTPNYRTRPRDCRPVLENRPS
jgi:hypothetical protein